MMVALPKHKLISFWCSWDLNLGLLFVDEILPTGNPQSFVKFDGNPKFTGTLLAVKFRGLYNPQ